MRGWALNAVLAFVCTAAEADNLNVECEHGRYLLSMSRAADTESNGAGALINGQPFKIYEGEPLEWTHYVARPLPCGDDGKGNGWRGDEGALAAIFRAVAKEVPESDLVPESCTDPVYLLVINTITDPKKYETYISLVRTSNTVPRHGRVRLIGSAPETVLHGAWPENTTAWLSRWPCEQAFHDMYTSNLLQEDILPLRDQAARYRLMMFRPAEGAAP